MVARIYVDDSPRLTPNRESWMDEAACVGKDIDEFFPQRNSSPVRGKEICASCTVRLQCLAWIMAIEDPASRQGIVGGLQAYERKELAEKLEQYKDNKKEEEEDGQT